MQREFIGVYSLLVTSYSDNDSRIFRDTEQSILIVHFDETPSQLIFNYITCVNVINAVGMRLGCRGKILEWNRELGVGLGWGWEKRVGYVKLSPGDADVVPRSFRKASKRFFVDFAKKDIVFDIAKEFVYPLNEMR
ncbi:hypothetical protein M0804_010863 [Polistes exclamans]|nr:hypothetical protein M0804_010863 [Polistes exclamans]